MIDPVTAIAGATAAFNAIKSGFSVGRDIESMAGDLGRWMNCVSDLKKAGLYNNYEKQMMKGNLGSFAKNVEEWIKESLDSSFSMVTEQGDIEAWGDISKNEKQKILSNLKSYIEIVNKHLE